VPLPRAQAPFPRTQCLRRYRIPEVHLAHYSSREAGARLADSIAAAAGAAAGAHGGEAPEPAAAGQRNDDEGGCAGDTLPSLQEARIEGCDLPGGWSFALAARGSHMAAPALVAPPGGVSVLSHCCGGASGGGAVEGAGGQAPETAGSAACGVTSIVVGADGRTCQAAFLGPRVSAPAPERLAALVGLHAAYAAEGLGLQHVLRGFLPAGAARSAGAAAAAAVAAPAAGGVRQPVVVDADLAARLAAPWADLFALDGGAMVRREISGAAAAARSGRRGGLLTGVVGQEAVDPAGAAAAAAAIVIGMVEAAPPGDLCRLRRRILEARRLQAAACGTP
jgi:hypothetical protein